MLQSYSVRNFHSFRDRVDVDWRQNAKVPETSWSALSPTNVRVGKVMAVLGHNASGKTTLLKALVFLDWFVCNSFQQLGNEAKIPVKAHFTASSEPVEFEIIGEFEGQLWKYELRCSEDRVLYEALYRKQKTFRYVFLREWDVDNKKYNVKQQDFGFTVGKAEKACNQRPNASLIAIAAQYGIPLAVKMAVSGIRSNIVEIGRIHLSTNEIFSAAESFAENDEQQQKMRSLLRVWDLGLSDIQLEMAEFNHTDGSTVKKWVPYGVHSINGKDYRMVLFQESSGTQGAFVLLSRILPTLLKGGIAVIDEFESDLHPHMLEPILDLFANPVTNPHNAQLLFTCHAAEVLNLLPKAQVMLVEKDVNCESRSWRLDEMQGIRNDDNFYGKYMAGAYGAVPNL